jgi:hypothetical protein
LQTAALNYKLIKKIKDDRFDEDKIHQYYLLIQVGVRDLQICVIESEGQRVLLLEDYVFPALASHDELLKILDLLFDSHHLLKAAFWKKIKISIKNNKFVQVPEALYVDEARSEYLRYNSHVSPDESDYGISNPRVNALTVFSVPKELTGWFTNLYGNNTPVFMHQSAALIEGVMQSIERKKDDHLYIYVDRFKLHIVASQAGKLLYYNQFNIKEFSDYVRYIMLVMKSLNRDQKSSRVMLWGYIGKNSAYYHEFYKYISNVEFGARPSYLKFGYMFDEVQDHHFFDLYSMHLLGNE